MGQHQAEMENFQREAAELAAALAALAGRFELENRILHHPESDERVLAELLRVSRLAEGEFAEEITQLANAIMSPIAPQLAVADLGVNTTFGQLLHQVFRLALRVAASFNANPRAAVLADRRVATAYDRLTRPGGYPPHYEATPLLSAITTAGYPTDRRHEAWHSQWPLVDDPTVAEGLKRIERAWGQRQNAQWDEAYGEDWRFFNLIARYLLESRETRCEVVPTPGYEQIRIVAVREKRLLRVVADGVLPREWALNYLRNGAYAHFDSSGCMIRVARDGESRKVYGEWLKTVAEGLLELGRREVMRRQFVRMPLEEIVTASGLFPPAS